MLFDVQLVLSGQVQSILKGPSIVNPVRGGDAPGAMVEAAEAVDLESGHGCGGSSRVRRLNVGNATKTLVERIWIACIRTVVVVDVGLVLLVVEAFLGRQHGLDGTVLVDHLPLETFRRAQMFQAPFGVLWFWMVVVIIRGGLGQSLLMLVKVAVGMLPVKGSDGTGGLLDRLADPFVVVVGVSGQRWLR